MEREKVKKYFERMGLELPEQIVPDSALLRELQFAHCTHIPYENLDIIRGIPLSLDVDDLYKKIVEEGKPAEFFAAPRTERAKQFLKCVL